MSFLPLFDHYVFKFRIGVAGDQTQLNVRAVVGHLVGLGSVVKFCAVIGDLHIKLTVGVQGHGVGGDLQPQLDLVGEASLVGASRAVVVVGTDMEGGGGAVCPRDISAGGTQVETVGLALFVDKLKSCGGVLASAILADGNVSLEYHAVA